MMDVEAPEKHGRLSDRVVKREDSERSLKRPKGKLDAHGRLSDRGL